MRTKSSMLESDVRAVAMWPDGQDDKFVESEREREL